MSRSLLFAAALALAVSTAPAALMAGDVNQSATNTDDVPNVGTITGVGDLNGSDTSLSVSATGAASGVSITGTVVEFTGPAGGFNTVRQSSTNTSGAIITNTGLISGTDIDLNGTSSSLSVSAVGASAAISIAGSDGTFTTPAFGNVLEQVSDNDATVTNAGSIRNVDRLVGTGSALSISAIGAQSSTGVFFADSSYTLVDFGHFGTGSIANPGQVATNSGAVTNSVTGGNNASRTNAGELLGNGTSFSIGATGAVASFSFAAINSGTGSVDVGNVYQTALNSGEISNTAHVNGTVVGNLTGHGASVSIAATGSVAGISVSHIATTGGTATMFANITQISENSQDVTNTGDTLTAGILGGDNSSVSIGASGAVASVSHSSTANGNASTAPTPSVNNVNQTVTNASGGIITNTGQITTGALNGEGSSVSLSASGAVASVSASSVNDNLPVNPSANNVTQDATNNASVNNTSSGVSVGNLTGHGASASVSATGSIAAVNVSHIAATAPVTASVGNISQESDNTGAITNTGGTLTVNGSLGAGTISGDSTSASISASGAIAAVSSSSTRNSAGGAPSLTVGSITQDVTNSSSGDIDNSGTIAADSLLGEASSVSISATGGAASVAVSSVNDTSIVAASVGNINQTVSSAGMVQNTGTINLNGNLAGNGSAASVAAVGAGAFVSFSSVGSTP